MTPYLSGAQGTSRPRSLVLEPPWALCGNGALVPILAAEISHVENAARVPKDLKSRNLEVARRPAVV